MEVVVILPLTTRGIGEQLSKEYAAQKMQHQQALYQILSALKFLSRQGLAIRGDGDESDGNLQHLLLMKALQDPNLVEWLKQKENVYTSPEIQNEMLKAMLTSAIKDVLIRMNIPFQKLQG